MSSPELRDAGVERPSRTRYVVLAYLSAMAFILYLDRVCIAQAVTPIQAELGLTNTEMSYVLMAFTLAYGLLEIPTGHWGDRYGSRRILARIVIWWSAFTALTAACLGFYSLLAVRFLFGAGEAGAYPNAARIITKWFPHREKGLVMGFFQAASLIGGAVSPTVAGFLIERTGWRWPFVIFGATGVAWAAAFYWWFRDEPSEHPQVNAGEAALLASQTTGRSSEHPSVPWAEVLLHPTIWLLGFSTSCSAFNSYLYFSWYSKYLQAARKVGQFESGQMSSVVLCGGVLGTMIGGFILDRFIRHMQNTVLARRVIACSCMSCGALLLFISVRMESAWASALLAALSCVALFTQQTLWWSCATEVSGRYVGALFGLMNGMGMFGAMSSQYVVGAFADYRATLGFSGREQWDPVFNIFVVVLMMSAACWTLINPSRVIGAKAGDGTGERRA